MVTVKHTETFFGTHGRLYKYRWLC